MLKTQHKFTSSESLLRDVIERQTGSLDKAVKELVQNGIDAGSKQIKIYIGRKLVVVENDGRAMTKAEILSVFTTFGESYKRGRGNSIGEFGMGRGQIMPFGLCQWQSGNWKMTVDIKKFLGYQLRKTKTYRAGTRVVCYLKDNMSTWDSDRVKNKLRKALLPLPKMDIFINEYPVDSITHVRDKISTEEFIIFTHSSAESMIYNQGLSVCQIPRSMHNYCVHVIPKGKLNFARNEFMEGDGLTTKLWKYLKEVEQKLIVEKKDLDFNDAKRVLRMIDRGWLKLDEYLMNKAFIPSSSDHKYSFKELLGNSILFSDRNIWADDCLQQGYFVLHDDVYQEIENIIDEYELDIDISEDDVQDLAHKGYHEKCDPHELGGKQVYYYAMLKMQEEVFYPYEYQREIRLGKSDVAMGWTDGYDTIWVNKSVLQYGQDKVHILTKLWRVLCHEYAHNDDNIKEDYHNNNFYREYHQITDDTLGRMATFIQTCNLNQLKKQNNL